MGAILYRDKVYGVGGSIIEGYYKVADGKFYEEDTYTTEIPGAEDLLYIDLTSKMQFIFDGTNFVNITEDAKPTVTEASSRTNIASGDTLKTIIGKIKKFFADLKAVAFSGSYSDLTGKPTKLSDFTDDVVAGNYLPLSGGTVDGYLHVKRYNTTTPFSVDGTSTSAYMAFRNADGTALHGSIGVHNDNLPYINSINGTKRMALLEEVKDGTLTIKRNNASVGTFTANQSSASDINIECATPSDVEGSKTATGSVVTVTDAADIYAEEVDVAVVATQSGSGTPSPSNVRPIQGYDIVSVDRCGKNLFNPTGAIANCSFSGGIYTLNTSPLSNTSALIGTIMLPVGTYKINGGYSNAFRIYINIDGNNYTSSGSDVEFTVTKTGTYSVYAVVVSGATTGIKIKPMIRLASVTDSTFEVCDEQKLSLQLGNKNLLPITVEGIKAANTTGTWNNNVYTRNEGTFTLLTDSENNVTGIKVNGTFSGTTWFILGIPSIETGTYTLNGCPSGGGYDTYRITNDAQTFNDDGNGVGGTLSSEELYIRVAAITVSNKIFQPMLRYSYISDPTFSPYNPTLGGMVYGGNLTLNDDGSAVFVGDRVYREFTANDSNTWNLLSGYSNTFYCAWTKDSVAPTATGTDGVCSSYNVVRKVIANLANGEITLNHTSISSAYSSACVKDTQYSTAADFKASLTTPLQIVYPLATPFTIYLTAEQLQLLQGTNNVWSNAGNVTLKYQPDNVIAEPKGKVQQLYGKSVIQKDVLYQKGSVNTNPDTITLAKPCTNYDLLIVRIIIINSGAPTYTVDCTFNTDGLLTNCIFCNASSGSTRFVAYIVTDSMTLTKSSVSQNCFIKTIWGVKFTL